MTSWRDPHETVGRLGRHAKSDADEAFLQALNRAVAAAAWPVNRSDEASSAPIVYIVGAPRSGTTLLSQIASKYLEIGYIDNLIARFWLRPSAGIALSRICLRNARHTISLRSSFGTTPDIAGPHEFGYFWRHWLPLDAAPTHHLSDADLARVDAAGLRAALETEILGGFGTPVMFKNVICGFHARFLTAVHEPSLFVHITRDPVATACSVLQARAARYGSIDAWWSLKPAAMDQVLRPGHAAEEVARQVYHCRREIGGELSSPGVRRLDMRYEDLCRDPEHELGRLVDAVAGLGGRIGRVGGAIEALEASPGPEVDGAHRDAMVRYFNDAGSSHTL